MSDFPSVRVEVGFASAPDAPQVWEDVTAYTRGAITLTRGRSDEDARATPGRLSLTLDNTDGRFTYGNASGAYYPNVKPRRRIRVSVSPDDGATWAPRFDGYVDGWPVAWDASEADAYVTVTASDRLSRFGLLRPLRDALAEELTSGYYDSWFDGAPWILDDPTFSVLGDTTRLGGGVNWLYGLQEQSSGTSTFGDVSGAGGPNLSALQIGTGGTIEPGAAGIMPEGTAVKFAPASANNGLLLYSANAAAYLGGEFSIWAQFAWDGSTSVAITQVGTAPDVRVILAATPTTVVATIYGDTTVTVTKTIATNDNRPHFALFTVFGTEARLSVDEETVATATMPTGMGGRISRGIYVGSVSSADPVQVAWVGFAAGYTDGDRRAELGMLGSAGAERSDLRVARILRWLGLSDDADIDEVGLSDVTYQATGGRTALDVIGEVCDVEGGVLFATGDGRVAFHSRSHRYNRPIDLSMSVDDVGAGLEVQVDSTRVVNDLTASRPRGATVRVRNRESISDYGELSQSVTLYAASDDDLRSAAEWTVNQRGDVAPRVESIEIDLLTNSSARAGVLAREIGDRLELTDVPTTAPGAASSVSVFIEGMTETIAPDSWRVAFATSPWRGYVWSLDDSTWSALDTTTVLAY